MINFRKSLIKFLKCQFSDNVHESTHNKTAQSMILLTFIYPKHTFFYTCKNRKSSDNFFQWSDLTKNQLTIFFRDWSNKRTDN